MTGDIFQVKYIRIITISNIIIVVLELQNDGFNSCTGAITTINLSIIYLDDFYSNATEFISRKYTIHFELWDGLRRGRTAVKILIKLLYRQ